VAAEEAGIANSACKALAASNIGKMAATEAGLARKTLAVSGLHKITADEPRVAASARKTSPSSRLREVAMDMPSVAALAPDVMVASLENLPPVIRAKARVKEQVRSAVEVVGNLDDEGRSSEVCAAESRTQFLKKRIDGQTTARIIDLADVVKDLVLLEDEPDKGPSARKVVVTVLTLGYSMWLPLVLFHI